MGKPDAPEPPDPRETSAAQTGTNVGTAVANNAMQMVNQYTPYGNLEYGQTGTYTYNDPFTGESYEVPTYSATTTLNPTQQATLDKSQMAEQNLAGLAEQQSGFLQDYLSKPAQFDTSAIEGRLTELGDQRLSPKFDRAREDLRSRLVNQGITPGSSAYNREMDILGQQENDAYNQLLLTGRGQAFGELAAMRNQPINEITALLSGSQVQNPSVGMMTPQGMPTTDNAGLINQNYNQRLANYQQQAAGRQSLLGGLFGLGAGALSGGYF